MIEAMKRRRFVKLCASAVAGIGASAETMAKDHTQYQRYGRVAMIDPQSREKVIASSLEVGETYLREACRTPTRALSWGIGFLHVSVRPPP